MQGGKISFQETSLFTIGVIRLSLLALVVVLLQFGLVYPALLLVLVLVITWLGKWWSRYGLKHIQVQANFLPPRLFAGEDTVLAVALHHHKWLPVIVDYTQNLTDLGGDEIGFSSLLSRWNAAARQFTLSLKRRGYYDFPLAKIICSDGMGFYSAQMDLDTHQPLVVYPRIVSLPELGIRATDLIGEQADRRYILPDPIQVAGLRPYTPDMPARLIHWKASAHQDTLMARIIEPSADYKLCLLLDMEAYADEQRADDLEAAISVLASLAMWADEMGIPFGVLINGVQKGLPGPVSVPIASGLHHTGLVLEKLARLTGSALDPLDDLLHRESGQLPWGSTLVIVGEHGPVTLPAGMNRLHHIPVPGADAAVNKEDMAL